MTALDGFAQKARKHGRWLKHFTIGVGATPVLVLQMGKVGSLAVFRALLEQTRVPVSHLHTFEQKHPRWEVRLLQGRYRVGDPLHIITPVREPAERLVSAAFQNQEEISRLYPGLSGPDAVVRAINDGWHDHPDDWFECNIKAPFGIDVYDWPFPEEGFQVYESGHTSLFVYKVELGMPRIQELLRWHLALPRFKIKRENDSAGKSYGEAYARVKNMEGLDRDVIKRVRADRYARHFYPST